MASKLIFVTGATGHSGRWFMRKLAEEKYQGMIRCSMRPHSDERLFADLNLNIEYVRGDLFDPQFIQSSLKGVSTLISFAGNTFSKSLVEHCQKQGVEWAILVHTTGRYSKFKSASAEYIKIEEDLVRTAFNITILRPTMIYGSHLDRNMWKLIHFLGRWPIFPLFGSGENLMQPVRAKDLGEAMYGVLVNQSRTQGKNYNLAGQNPQTYDSLVRTIIRELGRKVWVVKIPFWLCLRGAQIYESLSKNPLVTAEQVLRMSEDKKFDYSDATLDFGFKPVSFEVGIKDEVEEYINSMQIRKPN